MHSQRNGESLQGVVLNVGEDLYEKKSCLGLLKAGSRGGAQFPGDQGLYVCKSRGHRFEGPHGVGMRLISGRGRLTGMGFLICGYEFILSMSGFPSRSFDGRNVAYRPLEFYTTGEDFEKSVMFTWEGKADLGTISLEIVET